MLIWETQLTARARNEGCEENRREVHLRRMLILKIPNPKSQIPKPKSEPKSRLGPGCGDRLQDNAGV
jgi:hypothetical protein